MKRFKQYLESVQTMNSDKQVELKDYQDKVNYYNSHKSSFTSLFSKKEEEREQDASKIINGNIYLGMAWKLAKIQNNINNDTKKMSGNDITEEEKKIIQTNITNNTKQLNQLKSDINNKINNDLKNLQKE